MRQRGDGMNRHEGVDEVRLIKSALGIRWENLSCGSPDGALEGRTDGELGAGKVNEVDGCHLCAAGVGAGPGIVPRSSFSSAVFLI